jgi:hypothetical protein
LPALKATVSASAQGCFSLLVAAEIIAFPAVRAAAIAKEADVIARHASTHLDFEVCAALDTVRFNASNAFTGQSHGNHLLSVWDGWKQKRRGRMNGYAYWEE